MPRRLTPGATHTPPRRHTRSASLAAWADAGDSFASPELSSASTAAPGGGRSFRRLGGAPPLSEPRRSKASGAAPATDERHVAHSGRGRPRSRRPPARQPPAPEPPQTSAPRRRAQSNPPHARFPTSTAAPDDDALGPDDSFSDAAVDGMSAYALTRSEGRPRRSTRTAALAAATAMTANFTAAAAAFSNELWPEAPPSPERRRPTRESSGRVQKISASSVAPQQVSSTTSSSSSFSSSSFPAEAASVAETSGSVVRAPQKLGRPRRSHQIALSDTTVSDGPDVADMDVSAQQHNPDHQQRSNSKMLKNRSGRNSRPFQDISVTTISSLPDRILLADDEPFTPKEERPHQELFPDLDPLRQIPLLLFDPESSDMSLDVNTNGVFDGVPPPNSDSLPPLPHLAPSSVPAPAYRMVPHDTTEPSKSRHTQPVRKSYLRFIEPTESELAARVEYDMDEQDRAWLTTYNAERCVRKIKECSENLFEFIVDQIEKRWFDLTKDLPKAGRDETPYPEDITCAVCDDGEAENSNAIVFCDGCNLAVHQDCYGVPFIPEGQWLCRKCMLSPESRVACVLCPVEGGAFKQTSTSRWAHLVCAMWIPECHVANSVYMEPIEGIDTIPRSRWRLVCYICKSRYGAPIQCSNKSCFVAFHPSCARKAKLYMRMRGLNTGEPNAFRAYCDRHSPKEYRAIVDVDATLLAAQHELGGLDPQPALRRHKRATSHAGAVYDSDGSHSVTSPVSIVQRKRRRTGVDSDDESIDYVGDARGRNKGAWGVPGTVSSSPPPFSDMDTVKSSPANAVTRQFRGRQQQQMQHQQQQHQQQLQHQERQHRVLSLTTPAVPQYILHAVNEAAATFFPRKKIDIIIRIAKYWALKRESRRGTALLKRLHLEPWTATATANKEDEQHKGRKYELLMHLRRDMELVRLLVDLVRKREKEKEKLCRVRLELAEMLVCPVVVFLRPVLSQLKTHDRSRFFANPINIDEVPDYYMYVKNPMDFSTMTQKLDSYQYTTVDEFEADVDLIVDNCVMYNKADTIYAKAARRLRKFAAPVLQQVRARVAAAVKPNGVLNVDFDKSMFE